MSAAPSPICSSSTRARAASAPPRFPRNRGDEAVGFIDGLRGSARSADFASIVHGTTVGTNALLERKGARAGLDHHARLPRRAGDAPARPPPYLGPLGRFRAGDRARHARSRSASARSPSGTIRGASRSRRRSRAAARLLLGSGAEALAIVFINAYANPANELAALAAAARGLAERASRRLVADPARDPRVRAQPRPRRSMPICSRWSASYLGKLEGALAAERFGGRFHVVQSNGGVMSTATRAALPGAHGAVRPRSRRDRGRRDRARGRFPERRSPPTSAAPPSTSRSSSKARLRWRRRPRSISASSSARR